MRNSQKNQTKAKDTVYRSKKNGNTVLYAFKIISYEADSKVKDKHTYSKNSVAVDSFSFISGF